MNDWYFLVLLAILRYFEGALRRESSSGSQGGGSRLCKQDVGCKIDLTWFVCVCTLDACCLQSCTKYSATPRLDHVSLVRPGCIFLSRNLILSENMVRSSDDSDDIILPNDNKS